MTTPQPFDASPQTAHMGAGDLEPALLMTLYWSDRSLVTELADAVSLTFSLWASPRAGNPIIDHAAATVVDAANGIVKYVWAAGDTDEPGEYYGRFFVELSDGRNGSWPDDKYVTVVISAAGAASDTPPPDDVAQGLIQPEGEVGGTWSHLIVEEEHSGSSHAQVAAAAMLALNAHRDVGVDQHILYAKADRTRGMYATAVNLYDEQFDGTDQERFDAAIAYATGIGGGRIVIPEGTFTLTDLLPASGVILDGQGRGVTILQLDAAAPTGARVVHADPTATVDGFEMRNLTIDGNKSAWGQDDDADTGCVDLTADPGNLTNVHLFNVEVVNGQSVGFVMGDASGSRLEGVTAHDNGWSSGTGANIDAVGIDIESTDVLLHGCRSYTNASHGYLIAGTTILPTLVVCDAHANGGDGIHVAGSTSMCRIVGCVARQNTGNGINVIGATFPAIEAATVVESNGTGGIVFNGVTAGKIHGTLVKANDTTASGADEVLLTGTTTGCAVVGNVIVASASQYAINEATSADTGNEISGNRLTAGLAGLVHLFSAASLSGSGSPASVVAAGVGSTWRRTNGGASTSFYVKESGAAVSTGWVAK
jgi:hypothetical protein